MSRASIISKAEEAIFTHRRLSLCAYSFLAANVISFTIRFFVGNWLIDKTGHFVYSDFQQWWIGGQFALQRNAAGAYNYYTYSAARALLEKTPTASYYRYVYPPTMLLLFEPIAGLHYVTGFFVWLAATLSLYAVVIFAILPSLLSVALALVPLPVAINVFGGDTAFLMAGLLALSMGLMGRRPYLSGLCLGLLTYKPQFVLFFPLALVITGQWRVVAGAVASASLFAGAATLFLGSNAWLLFLRSLEHLDPATMLLPGWDGLNQTVLGLMHQTGAGLIGAWSVHLAVALIATALACQIWTRPVSHSLKAAAFSIGALTVTPYMLAYDLTALSVPAAFLIADAMEHGFLPGERLALMGCFLASFLCFNLVVGPIVLLALMELVVRRVSYAMNLSAAAVAVPQLRLHPS